MDQAKKRSQNRRRQRASGKLADALLDAFDDALCAAPSEKPFDPLACARFVLSRAGAVILCGLICVLLVLVFYQIFPPKYEATAKLYVLENKDANVQLDALQTGALLLPDYREVFQTWEVHEAVRSRLDLDMTYGEMQRMLTVQSPSGSRLMYITVRHEDPVFAAELANAYAQAAHVFIAESLHGLEPDLFSSAIIPGHVSGLGLAKRILIAFAAGMVLAACGFVLFFCLDSRIRTEEDLARAVDAPAVISLPLRKDRAISAQEKEKACLLAADLLARRAGCVLVNAPHRGAGVSHVCEMLLRSLTALHRRTLWIQVEHRPFWNSASGKTLSDYLEERCGWEDLVQACEGGWWLPICGTEDDLPSQLFHPRMEKLMEELRNVYDVILVDAPPVTGHADACAFFACCDGAVLTVACGQTRLKDAAACAGRLSAGVPLLGAVLNDAAARETNAFRLLFSTKAGATL